MKSAIKSGTVRYRRTRLLTMVPLAKIIERAKPLVGTMKVLDSSNTYLLIYHHGF